MKGKAAAVGAAAASVTSHVFRSSFLNDKTPSMLGPWRMLSTWPPAKSSASSRRWLGQGVRVYAFKVPHEIETSQDMCHPLSGACRIFITYIGRIHTYIHIYIYMHISME